MRILMFSTDENILKEGTEVRNRMVEYGKLVEELHIIIKTKSEKLKAKNFGNIFLYPTSDWFSFFYFFNAYKIGKKIITQLLNYPITQLLITSQDPFETGLVGYFLKRKFKVPLQIQVHTDFLSPYFWKESLKNKLRVLIAKKIIPFADGIRVVSERIKKSLLSLYPKPHTLNPISVLPLLYDMKRFTDGAPNFDLHDKYSNHDFIILSASRLSREKNVGMAIRMMREVVKKHSKALLLIVGSGPEESKLKLIANRYKLQANVVFEPWTKNIVSYYKTADVFILTSNYEGGARSPAEAVASGLPIIMTDVPPAGELVVDNFNGFVVGVDDAGKMSEKITELISDRRKYLKFKENSLKMAEGFITKETYFRLYYKALADALIFANV